MSPGAAGRGAARPDRCGRAPAQALPRSGRRRRRASPAGREAQACGPCPCQYRADCGMASRRSWPRAPLRRAPPVHAARGSDPNRRRGWRNKPPPACGAPRGRCRGGRGRRSRSDRPDRDGAAIRAPAPRPVRRGGRTPRRPCAAARRDPLRPAAEMPRDARLRLAENGDQLAHGEFGDLQ